MYQTSVCGPEMDCIARYGHVLARAQASAASLSTRVYSAIFAGFTGSR